MVEEEVEVVDGAVKSALAMAYRRRSLDCGNRTTWNGDEVLSH